MHGSGGGGGVEEEEEGGEEEEGRKEVELARDERTRKAREEKKPSVRFEQKVLCTSRVFWCVRRGFKLWRTYSQS